MLQKSVHEWVDEENIINGILDLSDSSEIVEGISSESFEEIIWQAVAKRVLKNVLEEVVSGVSIKKESYDKPIASMIFIGPSWVWKTLSAKVTQKIFNKHFGNDLEIIKINCADYAWEQPHSLTRLTWASAWYIGVDKIPTLHPSKVEWKGRVILLDEIEKWWPPFWNMLLSLLDDGTLDINYVDLIVNNIEDKILDWKTTESIEESSLKTLFWDSIVIMTSNVWNDEVEKKLSWTWMGFWLWESWTGEVDIEKIFLEEFAQKFRIEMQWRFDYIIPFDHLSKEDAKEIIDQIINRLITNTLSTWNGFIIEFSESVKDKILEDICTSKDFRKFWWRSIEKYFKTKILPYIARAINSWKFREEEFHSCLLVTQHNKKIVFSKIPIQEMSWTKIKVASIVDDWWEDKKS